MVWMSLKWMFLLHVLSSQILNVVYFLKINLQWFISLLLDREFSGNFLHVLCIKINSGFIVFLFLSFIFFLGVAEEVVFFYHNTLEIISFFKIPFYEINTTSLSQFIRYFMVYKQRQAEAPFFSYDSDTLILNYFVNIKH